MAHRFRERPKHCEALAVRRDVALDDFWFHEVTENEVRESYVIVHVNGPLEHHACPYGDSYEALRERVGCAIETGKKTIIFRIDSPGGVVAGLNQAVADIRRSLENSGVYAIAYVDELAASAAYALSCVADEIVIPPSGIAGSVGVISTMVDFAKANEKAGVNVVTLVSGERKSDGHADVAITDEARAEEQRRVDELASQFFAIVKERRGIDAAPLEANIYLGEEAVEKGLADAVAGWEALISTVSETESPPKPNMQNSASSPLPQAGTIVHHSRMRTALTLAIKKTKAALAKAKGKQKTELRAQLVAFEAALEAAKKTKYHLEEEETVEEDTEPPEKEKEGGNDTDRQEDDMPGDEDEKKSESEEDEKKAESEEDEKKAESEDEEERAARVEKQAASLETMRQQLASLTAERDREKKHGLVDALRLGGFITPAESKELRKASLDWVKKYDALVRKTRKPLVLMGGEAMTMPELEHEATAPRSGNDWIEKQARQLSAMTGVPIEKVREQLERDATMATNGARH